MNVFEKFLDILWLEIWGEKGRLVFKEFEFD